MLHSSRPCSKIRFKYIFIISLLIISLSACGKGGKPEESTAVQTTATAQTTAQTTSTTAETTSAVINTTATSSSQSETSSTSATQPPFVSTADIFPLKDTAPEAHIYSKTAGASVVLACTINLPYFDNPTSSPIIDNINKTFSDLLSGYTALADSALYNMAMDAHGSGASTLPHTLNVDYVIKANSHTTLSVVITASVFDGGIHDYSYSFALNFDLSDGSLFTPAAVFNVTASKYLSEIYDRIYAEIDIDSEKYYSQYKDFIEQYSLYITNEAYSPLSIPLDRWYFSEEGLSVLYNPYEIATYSEGIITFTISYDDIGSILDVNPLY